MRGCTDVHVVLLELSKALDGMGCHTNIQVHGQAKEGSASAVDLSSEAVCMYSSSTVVYAWAGMSSDGSVLAVGAPDGRVVNVYTLENGQYVQSANITSPSSTPSAGRFGQQARSPSGLTLLAWSLLPDRACGCAEWKTE
jgi:hypothetical protein